MRGESSEPPRQGLPKGSLLSRVLWATLGILSVALAALGIVLPGLPTTPFLILAAACFARSSEKLYARLVSSKRFGPLIRDYRAGRGVPRRAKRWALSMMAIFLTIALGPGMPRDWLWQRGLVVAAGLIGAVYLHRLPTAAGDPPTN